MAIYQYRMPSSPRTAIKLAAEPSDTVDLVTKPLTPSIWSSSSLTRGDLAERRQLIPASFENVAMVVSSVSYQKQVCWSLGRCCDVKWQMGAVASTSSS